MPSRYLPFFLVVTCVLIAACDKPMSPPDETNVVAQATPNEDDVSPRPDPQRPENDNLAVPANWKVRLDRPDRPAIIGDDPDSSDIYFVNMVPGWHITSGPAAIYYHPASTASGAFRAEMAIHLFDPGDRREAFGIIFGGKDLDGAAQQYGYFLIRQGGEFLIKRRDGDATSVVRDWAPNEAIASYTPDSGSSQLNTLAVEARERDVAFFVNDTEVATVDRSALPTDGIVGLRLNHGLNVHVADFSVTSPLPDS